MRIRVLFFASCREAANCDSYDITIDDSDSNDFDTNMLLSTLRKDIPAIEVILDNISLAVNKSYVRGVVKLNDGDEIALLPPISGG